MKTLSPHSCALPARLCPLLCGLWLWAAVLGPTAWAQDVSLKGPLGGWRNSAISEERDSAMHASYPSPPVDRGRQANRTLIEGRLRQVGSNRHPPRYVVNGINMPLYADDQGVFVKPWAFGPGSNSLEFKLPNGGKGRRVQFVEANPNKTRAKVRIVLGWDDPKAELDLHILTPDGEHAFWARPQLNAGGGLDVDSVDGGGPEIFSTATPVPGTYLITSITGVILTPAATTLTAKRTKNP